MVNPNPTNLYAEKVDVFHTTINKALFLYKMKRSDIQPTVSLLRAIVQVTDEDHW